MRKLLASLAALAAIVAGGTAAAPAAAAPAVPIKATAAQAAPDNAREWVAKDKSARKGAPPVITRGKSGKASVQAVPTAAPLPPNGSAVYWYAGGVEFDTNQGAFAGMKSYNSGYRHSNDNHTHAEIAVIDTTLGQGMRNMVEIGRGNTYCAGTPPCLWGFHWVKGVPAPGGYNSAFTDYTASSLNLGDSLAGTTETAGCTSSASARNQRFGIRWNATTPGWMLWADLCYGDATAGQWLGIFLASLWTSQGVTFTTSNQVQVFEEVTSWYDPATNPSFDGIPCSDAGPGGLANSGSTYPGSGQRIADVTLQNVANANVNMDLFADGGGSLGLDPSGMYASVALAGQPAGNVRYFNAGGPGSAGTTPGVKSTPGVAGGC